jgi:hypothetical protein
MMRSKSRWWQHMLGLGLLSLLIVGMAFLHASGPLGALTGQEVMLSLTISTVI